jgi:hypothetical protein
MVFEDFDSAAAAKHDGQMICGVRLEDQSDRYFLMPVTASNEDVSRRSFEIYHGKPMSRYQEFVMELALRRLAKRPAPEAIEATAV